MSIERIKEVAKIIKEGSLLTVIKSTPAFGYENPYSLVEELLDAIEAYKEPNPVVDTPPKSTRRTRRTAKKEESVE